MSGQQLPQYRRVTSYTPGKRNPSKLQSEPPKKRGFFKKFLFFLLGCLIGLGLFAGWIIVKNGHIFKGNVLSLINQSKPLAKDQYGRTNVLVFGTSEDDPGHPGGDLTDSILLVSLNQTTKTAFTVSIPRDLWVHYGDSCNYGSGKINALYSCVKLNGGNEQAGEAALRSKVSEVTGADVAYSVHLNNTVVQQVVDALGGIDITIQSTDPRGILDRNFDWRCRYRCYLVKYPNGPVHLNGTQAKYLAQARGASGGYGLARGNFDREANQRKIIMGIKQKASSSGFLQNPLTVIKLMNSLGDNLRTNIPTDQVQTFIKALRNTTTIDSISIIDQKPLILTTGSGPDGTSIVRPVAGLYDYDDLQTFMESKLKPPPAQTTGSTSATPSQ